jgi:hypothetical protein
MTPQEYAEHVDSVAIHILTDLEAAEWVYENQDDAEDSWKFIDDKEYNGSVHEILDAHCELEREDYKEAIKILGASDSDPDGVDPGYYEGSSWKQTLVVIAFSLFEQDVHERLEHYFSSGEFPKGVLVYPSNGTQIGFFPTMVSYTVPLFAGVVVTDSFVKIIPAVESEKVSCVVFEGEPDVDEDLGEVSVLCKRIYVQGGENINDAVKRCIEDYGVSED